MNMCRINRLIACALDDSGLLAKVIFRRIEKELSGEVDDFYGERRKENKVYQSFVVNALVDENPKHNVYGPGGGEKIGDLDVIFYGDQNYTPHLADHILWREEKYEVTKTERINPFGENSQLGWRVTGTRFS